MSTVGKRIKEMRKQLNLTQIQLALVLNISQGTLSDVEKDNRTLPYEAVISLFKYLEDKSITFKYLITGNNAEPKEEEPELPLGLNDELLEKFDQLDTRDKNDIIDIIEMKYERIKPKQKSYTSNNTEKQSKSANEIA